MPSADIIRAWKDPEYRASLSDEARAHLPHHPAGLVELSDEELGLAAGARVDSSYDTYNCYTNNCPGSYMVCSPDTLYCPPHTFHCPPPTQDDPPLQGGATGRREGIP